MSWFSGSVLMLLPILTVAQQRDARPAVVGTGEISGVVMSAGSTPEPVRRVVVSISGDLAESRSVITDATGRFTFSRLPAGSFTVTARKVAYLPTQFGVTRPGRAGSAIALDTGEKRQVTLTIFRGAVIAGALRDSTGAPLAGVSVAAVDVRLRSGNAPAPTPETTTTDDRGMYRFYGVPPSDYVIAASPAPPGSGEIGAPSGAELDSLFATLTDRLNRPPAAAPPLRMSAPRSIGYAPLYYPGTPLFSDAARIRVGTGEEKDAVNFTVTHVPVASIEGTVTGEVANPASAILAIVPDSPRLGNMPGTFGITSEPPSATGEFKYGNLAPGRYRIVARARRGPGAPGGQAAPAAVGGMRGGAPPAGVNLQAVGEFLYGVADVEVRGQDVKGVNLNLQLGGFLSGRIVFDREKAPVPDDLTAFRIAVNQVGGGGLASSGSTRVGGAINNIPPVNVKEDGTFLLTALGPAFYYLVTMPPAALTSTWKARSAMVDGRDLLDMNLEGPNIQLSNVLITFSDKRTEISGTLQSASRQPVSDYFVIAFSVDRANWRYGSRRNLSARPATNGRFTLADLPAGEYFIAALTDLDPMDWQDASFLEQVAPAAVKVTLLEGEKKVQDLRIR